MMSFDALDAQIERITAEKSDVAVRGRCSR
jgi:hypothetical protein